MLYRIKQFIWAIISNYKELDIEYLNTYLNKDELELFSTLSKIDKQHSIRVSKEALHILNEEVANKELKESESFKCELAKAGLLHDIGKSEIPLNPFSKMLAVIIDKATKGKYRYKKNGKLLDSYYNHPFKGEKLLLNSNKEFSKELIEVVSLHHKSDEYVNRSNNYLLKIVKIADDRN